MLVKLLTQASFRCQRFLEAQEIANFIAEACPNPRLVAVGIEELIINAIEHGNLQITYTQKEKLQRNKAWLEEIDRRLTLPQYSNKYVQIDFKHTPQAIFITITDEGDGFAWQQHQQLDVQHATNSHGRGIMLAKQLAFQELRYDNKGNQVIGVINL